MLTSDTALEVTVLFEPQYNPLNKRRTQYGLILRARSGKLLRGLKLKFNAVGTFSIHYPKGLMLEEVTKIIIKRLVDQAIRTKIRKLDTGAIEDRYLLGHITNESSWRTFLREVGLE